MRDREDARLGGRLLELLPSSPELSEDVSTDICVCNKKTVLLEYFNESNCYQYDIPSESGGCCMEVPVPSLTSSTTPTQSHKLCS